MKTYIKHMNDISSDEPYIKLLGYGMFAEKLRPLFTSDSRGAIHLRDTSMDQYWIIVYEALEEAEPDKEWKAIKKEKVSFVRLPSKEEVSL